MGAVSQPGVNLGRIQGLVVDGEAVGVVVVLGHWDPAPHHSVRGFAMPKGTRGCPLGRLRARVRVNVGNDMAREGSTHKIVAELIARLGRED